MSISLSPHICILPSDDLTDLLSASSLPPLPHILQSFSPLPQVTTRTTALVSVPHSSFALRFSDLTEIEAATHEDQEHRAVRTIDWIAARIHKRSQKWVDDVEKLPEKDDPRTPWWDELRRCVEGDHVPSKVEAWNHPIAVILAVSTTAPNPLQAITALHSRPLDLPPWVDRNILRYTLIIHPQNSPLSDEEAGALFNAVKRQYGLHSYLLSLNMPVPPPPPVPVPALIPRLPPPKNSNTTTADPSVLDSTYPDGRPSLKMSEKDIQQTARFTREFVVMSLLPWMEKCVVEWNENFSSTRRLPSRLFSSTRRLFGSPSPSPSPSPIHTSSSSISSLPSRTPHLGSPDVQGGPSVTPPSQLRRLAEFATILGDLKLAISVWETLRKESKGGSDILPLLLSPSLASPLHASNALSSLNRSSEPRALEHFLALKYAVRWEVGISRTDFTAHPLEAERWLVWAAGNAEEPTSALLLAHAALLSSGKKARRRAALWYLSAANKMEKCGIKPLTMYFLRKAHGLYSNRPQKSLSPSFWDSEGKSPSDVQASDAIMAGIEHPLGRLLYTTGDIAGAVRCFLGLLRGSSGVRGFQPNPSAFVPVNEAVKVPGSDKVFLDDFRVAFSHFKSTSDGNAELADLKLPFTFCLTWKTCIRLPMDDVATSEVWEARAEDWQAYRKSRGHKEGSITGGKASVDETFWIDLVLLNPLEVEVNLSNLTVVAQEVKSSDSSSFPNFVEIESVNDIILGAKESHTISIWVKSSRPASLMFTHATYDFLSLLPSSESLAFRGRRLHDTPAQRQKVTYAPDIVVKVEVQEVKHRLLVDFVEDERLVLAQGEKRSMRLWFSNTGLLPIREVWMLAGRDDVIWVGADKEPGDADVPEALENLQSSNSLAPQSPRPIFPPSSHSSVLNPGDSVEIPVLLYADMIGERELSLLFVYRENDTDAFQSSRVTRSYEVHRLVDASLIARPSHSPNHSFLLILELYNLSHLEQIQVTQVTSLSAAWKCTPVFEHGCESLPPNQSTHLLFGANRREGAGPDVQQTLEFVSRKLGDIVQGRTLELSYPPPINLLCSHMSRTINPLNTRSSTWHLLSRGICNIVSRGVAVSHPLIPPDSLPFIFPLHTPDAVDFILFWAIPSQERAGHIFVPGPALRASHAALQEIIEKAENMKAKRSIYAETQREREGILQGVKNSEWNAEMNPLVLVLQEPDTSTYDFGQGPCRIPVTLAIRNYSSTHRSRFVLGLDPSPAPSNALSPPYIGQLTFRGTLDPEASKTFRATLWVTRPGTYHLGQWYLETEVLETSLDDERDVRVRHRYRQEQSAEDNPHLIICSLQSP